VYVAVTLKTALHLLLGHSTNSPFYIDELKFAFPNIPHECYVYTQLEPPRHYHHNIICEECIYLFGKFRITSPLRDDILAIQSVLNAISSVR
jgi:hypothetical protein